MVKIRMTRLGKHKSPAYRIVAVDSRKKRDGEYIALLGTYNLANKPALSLNKELVLEFLNKGAQPSETIKNFLKKEKIWQEFKNKNAK
ncbi:MAG: 30S ribosomal protein S16 [Mycoplasmataceae bacterium]|nr:30S ribosomal protein S16 [Mycoplasmataceae bacterium]